MSLEKEFNNFQIEYRNLLVAYTILTEKKIKAKAPEARKALMNIITISKELRKLVQEYKEAL